MNDATSTLKKKPWNETYHQGSPLDRCAISADTIILALWRTAKVTVLTDVSANAQRSEERAQILGE